MRNPFIPSRSRVCDLANLAMVFAVAAAGLAAAVSVIIIQVTL
jgi:hypothetical protein